MVKFEPHIFALQRVVNYIERENRGEKQRKALIKGKNCGRKVKRKMRMKEIKGKRKKGKGEKEGIGGKKGGGKKREEEEKVGGGGGGKERKGKKGKKMKVPWGRIELRIRGS